MIHCIKSPSRSFKFYFYRLMGSFMNKERLQSLLLDVRFWIILFFAIRCIGLLNPPIDPGHNWRQSLTLMIARNFFENNSTFLYPMVDNAGDKTGIIATEFPLFNYLIAICSKVFGYQHWYGRLINLLVSSIGLYATYQGLKTIFNQRLALFSTIALGCSIWFAYGQKIMPDTFSASLVLIALYFLIQYLTQGRSYALFFYLFFASLGILSKIPSISILAVVGICPFVKTLPWKRRLYACLSTLIGVMLCLYWYFVWNPYLFDTYKLTNFFPRSLTQGLLELIPLWQEALQKFYFAGLQSFTAFICFLLGSYFLVKKTNKLTQLTLFIYCTTYLVFVFKTGSIFPNHGYYMIPFVPFMAFFVGLFLYQLPKRIAWVFVSLIVIEGIANQQHHLFSNKKQFYKVALEEKINAFVRKDELVLINSNNPYQDLYFANRKGWTLSHQEMNDVQLVDSLIHRGAKYRIIDKHTFKYPLPTENVLYEDEDYGLYLLKPQI